LPYSPEPLSNQTEAVGIAGAFAALFAHVLNVSVAKHAHVPLVPVLREPWTDSTWLLSHVDSLKVPTAFELNDGTWLFAAQTLGVRESRRDGNRWLTTLQHAYQWQAEEDDNSWIVRWDYRREPNDEYPAAHIHVNGAPSTYPATGKVFPKLHLPAGRVALEEVVAFLVDEVGVPASSGTWREVVAESKEIFDRIQGRPADPTIA
jgi:hypothetical protein